MKEMNEMKETKLAKKSNDFFELVIIYSEKHWKLAEYGTSWK